MLLPKMELVSISPTQKAVGKTVFGIRNGESQVNIAIGIRGIGTRAACLVSIIAVVAVIAPMSASANVTPTVTKTYQSHVPGAVSDTSVTMDFAYDSTAEDLKNVSFEVAAGTVGNLSAIPFYSRCDAAAVGMVTGSFAPAPNYAACPASAKIGTGRLVLERPNIGDSCTLTGNLYLLRNDPELPTYIGSHLFSAAGCYAPVPVPTGLPAGAVQSITTSKIEILTNGDFRLRTTLMPETGAATGNGDFVAPAIVPFGPVAGNLRVKTIEENVDGVLDSGVVFQTNSTRCDRWETVVNAAALTTNTNFNYDIDSNGTNDRVRATNDTTPDCSTRAPFGPAFTTNFSSKARGQSPDVTFSIGVAAPVPGSDLPKVIKVTFPESTRSNIVGRSVCTIAQRDSRTCPDNSKIGTAKIYSPILMNPMLANVYLYEDSPLPGISIQVYGALNFNMNGTNTQTAAAALISTFENLPQLPFTLFEMTLPGGSGGAIAVAGCPSDASTPPNDIITYEFTSWGEQVITQQASLGLLPCRLVTVASVENCVRSKLNVTPIYRDRAAVTKGELFIDKRRVATSTKSPYKFGVDVSKYSAREHEIKVRATYSDGKQKIDKATFTVCAKAAARKRAGQRRTEPRFTG